MWLIAKEMPPGFFSRETMHTLWVCVRVFICLVMQNFVSDLSDSFGPV